MAPTRRWRSPSATPGTILGCYSTVDRLLRSIPITLETIELADLCPTLTPVRWQGHALVRLHGAVGARDGQPLRHSTDADARVLALAAGSGPVVVTAHQVSGVLLATPDRPAMAWALDWADVDDVSPAPTGGVLLLSTRLLGGVTLDPVGFSPSS